jgi:hypothetical protein
MVLIGVIACAVVLLIAGTAAPGWVVFHSEEIRPPNAQRWAITIEDGLFKQERTEENKVTDQKFVTTTPYDSTYYDSPACENNRDDRDVCDRRRAAAVLAAITCCLAGLSLIFLCALFCVHHDHWVAVLTYVFIFVTGLIGLLAWNVWLSVLYSGYAFYLFETGFLLFWSLGFWFFGGSHSRWSSKNEELNTAAAATDAGGRDAGQMGTRAV